LLTVGQRSISRWVFENVGGRKMTTKNFIITYCGGVIIGIIIGLYVLAPSSGPEINNNQLWGGIHAEHVDHTISIDLLRESIMIYQQRHLIRIEGKLDALAEEFDAAREPAIGEVVWLDEMD
jgi:hypothetical protein